MAYAPLHGGVTENFSTIARDLSRVARVAVLAPEYFPIDGDALVADLRFRYSARRPYRAVFGSGWRAHRQAALLRPRVVLLFTQHPLNILASAHLRRSRLAMWWHEPIGRGQVSTLKTLVYRVHDAVLAPLCMRILVAAPSVLSNVPSRYRSKTRVVAFATMPEFATQSGRFAGEPSDILFFGKLAPYKGLDVLARALQRLRQAGSQPMVRLIGTGSLQQAAPLMAAFQAEHPTQVVHIDEYAPAADIASALVSTRVLVLPYLSAAGSATISIAGMHDAVTVASRCGCFKDFLTDEESALLVTPGDDLELSVALTRALNDESLRHHIAAGLHAMTESAFDPDRVAAQLLDALDVAPASGTSSKG